MGVYMVKVGERQPQKVVGFFHSKVKTASPAILWQDWFVWI